MSLITLLSLGALLYASYCTVAGSRADMKTGGVMAVFVLGIHLLAGAVPDPVFLMSVAVLVLLMIRIVFLLAAWARLNERAAADEDDNPGRVQPIRDGGPNPRERRAERERPRQEPEDVQRGDGAAANPPAPDHDNPPRPEAHPNQIWPPQDAFDDQ